MSAATDELIGNARFDMGLSQALQLRRLIFGSVSVVFVALAAQATLASGLYTITATTGFGDQSWKIELASTPESRSRGLMFVESMPAKTGMLFRFDENREVSMWMKNTFISLDMIFLTYFSDTATAEIYTLRQRQMCIRDSLKADATPGRLNHTTFAAPPP